VAVMADASRIEQVVTNYLSNALKYSREDRPVVVRLDVDGETARVAVRDEGIGVAPAEQASIWDRFHRAAGVTIQSGSDVGIGIGLHICKTIIDGHHGQVGAFSVPGQGSTFWFTLPLASAP
jgi:signal transduction histidine kinase